MITDGIILMVVGMVVVFLFLLLLNLLIIGLSSLLKDHALQEQKTLLEAEVAKRNKKKAKLQEPRTAAAAPAEDVARVTAVISAALHAHRNR
ncbi:sodium pump decarboxylase subunit gamma [Prosthecochloris sp. GSB1]|uniref:OadG family protein n=1 Tax=Prosthecochloris sp. GSB1 TaxID=281093 RepID=UPI000B8C7736|nr:OadG family transporter subunit [Prosthecochloris sp. GSB1]ASQ90649.1 sodium pump decarboxylase subunit gamma [Prosthecochloris sp. GSB1]